MTPDVPFLSQVFGLMDDAIDERISIGEFSRRYETLWNFERRESELTAIESATLRTLFDIAAWYTPYPEDREANPSFKDADTVRAEIDRVRALLRGNTER